MISPISINNLDIKGHEMSSPMNAWTSYETM